MTENLHSWPTVFLFLACFRLPDNGGEQKIGASEEKKLKWGLGMEGRGFPRFFSSLAPIFRSSPLFESLEQAILFRALCIARENPRFRRFAPLRASSEKRKDYFAVFAAKSLYH